MAEQLELRSSKKSKGLLGKFSIRAKRNMRHQRKVFDDEESLVRDDEHETNNYDTVKTQQSQIKAEASCAARKRHSEGPIKEGSTQETGLRESPDGPNPYRSGVKHTDLNLSEVGVTTEDACILRVNAIIETNNDNGAEKYVEENKIGVLFTRNELHKSETCLFQNEKSTEASHFDNSVVTLPAATFDANREICEVQINPGPESEPNGGRTRKENTITADHVEDSPMLGSLPRCSTPSNSKIHRKESPKRKKKTKQLRKSNRKNRKNSEATDDDETSFQGLSSDNIDRDPETIEILAIDSDERKKKKKKQRKKAKRIVTKAGLTMWKGIRSGWKLMWSGLSMYTLPLGSLDVTTNITKFWSANSSNVKA